MQSPFFMNTQYTVNDLFIVKQGKLILEKDKLSSDNIFDDNDSKSINYKVLTLSSVDFDSKSIDKNTLKNYYHKNNSKEPNLLSANDYIINRVGKNKGLSLIDIDFDFDKTKVIASHHFIILTPRTIVLHNVPFFHLLIDVVLAEIIKNTITTKGQFLTVSAIQDIKISISFFEFDELLRNFTAIYEPYKKSLQNFNENKNKMDLFKMQINLKI